MYIEKDQYSTNYAFKYFYVEDTKLLKIIVFFLYICDGKY